MSLRETVFANAKLKALSLLLAVVLWLLATLESADETVVPVMVTLVNLPPGLILAAPAEEISLRIAGPRTLLIRQKWRGAALVLDCAGAGVGPVRFPAVERRVRLVPGVRLSEGGARDLELHLIRQQ